MSYMCYFNTWTDIVASAPAVTGSVFLRGYSHYFRDSVDVYILYLLQGAPFLILKIFTNYDKMFVGKKLKGRSSTIFQKCVSDF